MARLLTHGRVWREFTHGVMVQRSLLCYETAYKGQFRRILWRFAEDGISYAEIRLAMNYLFTIQSDDGTREYGHAEIIQMLADVLKEETPKIQASGITFYGVKIIYAVLRSAPKEAMKWCMDTCIELKQRFPDFICGRCLLILPSRTSLTNTSQLSICRARKILGIHSHTGSQSFLKCEPRSGI